MGRVTSAGVQPMNALGDLAYGGAGSPTGYESRAKTALGAVAISTRGTFGGAIANVLDENPATFTIILAPATGADIGADLAAPQRIGRVRFVGNAGETTGLDVQSSTDGVNWTTRMATAAHVANGDTGLLDLPAPITARYWRFRGSGGPAGQVGVYGIEFWSVTTVGAGNPTRLAPPAERRVLTFDPDAGVPQWQAPAAANADTAGATLANLEIEVNELKATLRAAGILAP